MCVKLFDFLIQLHHYFKANFVFIVVAVSTGTPGMRKGLNHHLLSAGQGFAVENVKPIIGSKQWISYGIVIDTIWTPPSRTW
jgi:hypothetical protein